MNAALVVDKLLGTTDPHFQYLARDHLGASLAGSGGPHPAANPTRRRLIPANRTHSKVSVSAVLVAKTCILGSTAIAVIALGEFREVDHC